MTREGGRPLLIELQALVDRMRFGAPRRVAQGLDANRLAMLLAAANRHAGVSLQEHDVFVNVVGGIEITETAWDLPVLLALASSLADRAIARALVAFGEIGLTGEVRPVAYGDERLKEAARAGIQAAPSCRRTTRRAGRVAGLAVTGVGRISEALDAVTAAGRHARLGGLRPPPAAARARCGSRCRRSAAPRTRSSRPAPWCRLSGMVSRCSSSSPLMVFGPSVGSCQPSARFSARMVALALTM